PRTPASSAISPLAPVASPIRSTIVSVAWATRSGESNAGPGISAQHIAQQLRLSARYVHDLLQETGSSFAEHILELRLQRAHRMLRDRRNDRMRVSEIALLSGFSDVSYFNRCFRRRFGSTPSSAR
ncbi:MAG: helix-turn-helix transcriptional regulator, partial [Mesorhizobium sp.]